MASVAVTDQGESTTSFALLDYWPWMVLASLELMMGQMLSIIANTHPEVNHGMVRVLLYQIYLQVLGLSRDVYTSL